MFPITLPAGNHTLKLAGYDFGTPAAFAGEIYDMPVGSLGDVWPTTYIAPNEFAYGLLYKWNKSPRHSWRFSYNQAKITSSDLKSNSPGRTQRGYNFENDLKEVSLGLEFNFFDFNLHDFETKITPYIYSGVSYFAYYELFYISGGQREDYRNGALAIPMVLGVKLNVFKNLVLSIEKL